MKRLFKKITVLLVALIMLSTSVLFVACGDDEEEGDGEAQYVLSLDTTSKGIALMEEFYVSATYNEMPDTTLTFASANDSIATVNSEGKVKGQSLGSTKITVTYGEATATCDVTVSLPAEKPSMSLLGVSNIGANIMVADDEPFDIIPVISYRGVEYQDAQVTFSGLDTSVGNIVDGKFVPNALATDEPKSTTITLNTSWRGVTSNDAPTLLETITVTVYKREISNGAHIYVNDTLAYPTGVELYLAPEVEGQTFINEVDFKVRAVIEGIMGEGTDGISIDYTTDNIVKVENDMLTAVGAGTTDVIVELSDDVKANLVGTPMEQLTKIVVPVIVRYPIVDKSEQNLGQILNVEGNLGLVSAKDGYSLSAVQEIFGEGQANQIVMAIENYSESGENNVALTVENGVLSGLTADKNAIKNTKVTLFTEGYGFTFSLDLITDFLTTEEELKEALKLKDIEVPMANGEITGDSKQHYADGTYIIQNDIHVTGNWSAGGYIYTYGWAKVESGFFGYIDGQGHKLTFDCLNGNGIFGAFGDGATLKNIDIEILAMNSTANNQNTILGQRLGYSFRGPDNTGHVNRAYTAAVLKNVSIRVIPDASKPIVQFDGLCARLSDKMQVEDVYIYLNENVTRMQKADSETDSYGLLSSIEYGNLSSARTNTSKITSLTLVTTFKELYGCKTTDSAKVGDTAQSKLFNLYASEADIPQSLIDYNETTDKAGDLSRFVVTGVSRYDNIGALTEAGVTQIGSWIINANGTVTYAD